MRWVIGTNSTTASPGSESTSSDGPSASASSAHRTASSSIDCSSLSASARTASMATRSSFDRPTGVSSIADPNPTRRHESAAPTSRVDASGSSPGAAGATSPIPWPPAGSSSTVRHVSPSPIRTTAGSHISPPVRNERSSNDVRSLSTVVPTSARANSNAASVESATWALRCPSNAALGSPTPMRWATSAYIDDASPAASAVITSSAWSRRASTASVPHASTSIRTSAPAAVTPSWTSATHGMPTWRASSLNSSTGTSAANHQS